MESKQTLMLLSNQAAVRMTIADFMRGLDDWQLHCSGSEAEGKEQGITPDLLFIDLTSLPQTEAPFPSSAWEGVPRIVLSSTCGALGEESSAPVRAADCLAQLPNRESFLNRLRHHGDRRRHERELRLQLEQHLLQALPKAALLIDREGMIRLVNHRLITLFGLPEAGVRGESVALLFAADWFSSTWMERFPFFPEMNTPEATYLVEGVGRRWDGTRFPLELSLSWWPRPEGPWLVATIRDISRCRQLEARDLRAYANRIAISALLEVGLEPITLQRKLQVALEIILTVPWLSVQYKGSIFLAAPNGSLTMVGDKGLDPHLLQSCQKIPLGYCLCGRAAQSRELLFTDHVDEHHDVTFPRMKQHGHYCVPVVLRDQLLGLLNLYVDHEHDRDPEEEAFLYTIANTLAGIIERGLAEEKIRHLATHDSLTGLPNRTLFLELLDREVLHARRNHDTMAVVFIDMDRVKEVNDTLGHAGGDHLLRQVALRLRNALRASDTPGRLGGDEFACILPAIGDGDNAVAVCEKLLQALLQPMALGSTENLWQIGASIGIALYPDHGHSAAALLAQADLAMYTVKHHGRRGIHLHGQERIEEPM